jgi:hypothetical protein
MHAAGQPCLKLHLQRLSDARCSAIAVSKNIRTAVSKELCVLTFPVLEAPRYQD